MTGISGKRTFRLFLLSLEMTPEADPELPYEGTKEMLLVDDVENREFLRELVEGMYEELPAPKRQKKEKGAL